MLLEWAEQAAAILQEILAADPMRRAITESLRGAFSPTLRLDKLAAIFLGQVRRNAPPKIGELALDVSSRHYFSLGCGKRGANLKSLSLGRSTTGRKGGL